jgi:hypothetical protein
MKLLPKTFGGERELSIRGISDVVKRCLIVPLFSKLAIIEFFHKVST